jgi:hypothetical protein
MTEDVAQPSLFEAAETDRIWRSIAIPTAMEAVARDQGRLIGFCGHRGLLTLGHYLMAWRLLQDESVLLVDGANIVDLPLILRLLRENQENHKDRRALLSRIHLSRAFTVHQLEAVIGERLEGAFHKYQSRLCFVSGLLDTFYDEEVPLWEAKRILRRVLERLRHLADGGRRVIVIAPDPPGTATKRRGFVPRVANAADRVFTLVNENGALSLKDEAASSGKPWALPAIQLRMKRYPPR